MYIKQYTPASTMHYYPWGDSAVKAIFKFILINKKQNVTTTVYTTAADVLNAFQRQLQSTEKSLKNMYQNIIQLYYARIGQRSPQRDTARQSNAKIVDKGVGGAAIAQSHTHTINGRCVRCVSRFFFGHMISLYHYDCTL